ncbi:Calmodulin-binding, putative [Angomonas deanei]|uniref:Calmodulin-binding, putative n=1 Tax=Angomonas deanei TaxID=59799 RepID=A0A7G2CPY8_9TRYP|nr:Calmodulin-binding, putative [Angomonas deanei]
MVLFLRLSVNLFSPLLSAHCLYWAGRTCFCNYSHFFVLNQQTIKRNNRPKPAKQAFSRMSNAARQNRQLLREQQQLNAERRSQDSAGMAKRSQEVKKTQAQYDHVQPRVGKGAAPAGGASNDDVEIKVYVRECEDSSEFFRFMENEGQPTSGAAPARPAASKRTPSTKKSVKGAPRSGSTKRAAAEPTAPAEGRGKVPKYLQKRMAEMEAEKQAIEDEKQRKKELAKIPPGHRAVSEEEKADTLERLAARRAELEAELGKIPLRFDTVSIRNKRQAIEDELQQIESTRVKYNTKGALYVPI